MASGLCTKKSKRITLIRFLIIIPLLFYWIPNTYAGQPLDSLVNNAVKISLNHLENSVKEVRDTTLFPTYGTKDLKWQLKSADDWTSGFYPGCFWYAYKLSGDQRFEHWAKQWTSSLEEQKYNSQSHDLGFKFICSYANGLKFDSSLEESNYKSIILTAASTLSKRYSPIVKCLSSDWDLKPIKDSYPVIIDIMMNLKLLFWASEHGGPAYYAEYARNHALVTARDFIRLDGSTYHIVRYNKNTGAIINKGTLQGAGNETTWSRGQAWGIYGFVTVYRYTKAKQFLNDAIKLANYFIKHLPKDQIAPWDFQSKIKQRDVSASAIVCSALFEIVRYVKSDSLKSFYTTEAEAILKSLCRAPYFSGNKNTNCLLEHSVGFFPHNTDVDVPAIFADYYFLESIVRYRQMENEPRN